MDDMTSDKKLLRVVEKTDILLYIINSKKEDFHLARISNFETKAMSLF